MLRADLRWRFPFGALADRRSARWMWLVLLAGIALRELFIHRYSFIPVDATIYADLAKTWLNQHVYGFGNVPNNPTLIRLPGYPALIAVLFRIFGVDHFTPIYVTQLITDLGTCFATGWLARELFPGTTGERAGRIAFALAAFCPFIAQYTALALTETLAIFSATTACLFFVRAVHRVEVSATRDVVLCGIASAYGILLRPDGGILLATFVAYFLFYAASEKSVRIARMAVLLGTVALLPLVPWTIRNWHTFHVFQPLAPRYATAPGEYIPLGFNRWTKTWMVDYASVEEVFWKFSSEGQGEEVDAAQLPDRAFDSAEERDEVSSLIDDYNETLVLSPEMDAHFAAIAHRRVRSHPVRYYLELPALRIADMWFRPRTETVPIDTRWWEFADTTESIFAMSYAGLDIVLVLLGCWGMFRFRRIQVPGWGALVGFIVLRSIFLATLENPEPRYTLECLPVLLAFAAAVLSGAKKELDSTSG